MLSPEEMDRVRGEISQLVADWYERWTATGVEGKDWEEVANRKPAWKNGQWSPESGSTEDVELGFRRLYRMTLRSQLFDQLSKHERIMGIVNQLIGPDVKLLQSMALLKPPGELCYSDCY